MSALAPTIEAFFTERLLNQRHASPAPSPPTEIRCGYCWSSRATAWARHRPSSIWPTWMGSSLYQVGLVIK